MELMVNKETVAINEVVFDGASELPIESDFMLPDYCPDIVRVLKCNLEPVVTAKQATGDKVMIDGVAELKLLYVAEDELIRNYEYKLPFSKTVTMKGQADNPIVFAAASTDYVNCRAVSQRRLDVRGALSVAVKVMVQHGESIVSGASGQSIQLKKKNTYVSQVVSDVSRQFTVREELELSGGKPKIEHIVNKVVHVNITDNKVMANKIMVKADMTIKLSYISHDRNLYTCEFSLPVSQVVDVAGVDETCRCTVNLRMHDCDVILRPDLDEDGSALDIEVTLGAEVKAYCSCEIPAVNDLYSTEFETTYQTKMVTLNNLIDVVKEEYSEKNTFEMPDENIVDVLDVWSSSQVRSVRFIDGEFHMVSLVRISMLVKNAEGIVQFFERGMDSEYTFPCSICTENMTAEYDIQSINCSYEKVSEASIEIKVDLAVTASIFGILKENVIYDLQINEEAPKKKLDLPALTIYYADANESIWEIAKKYNTSVTAILEQNEIEKEILSGRQMLLIPVAD